MKAIGYKESLPVTNINSLIDIELPIPEATGHDLLVGDIRMAWPERIGNIAIIL